MRKKLTIEQMKEQAAERGGKCLSAKYITARANLKWQCAEGHVWETSYNHVRRGSWCGKCAIYRQKHTIEEMQTLAASRGGYCLSKKYINTKTKLIWKCSRSHIWENTPGHILSGQWCVWCAGLHQHTIEQAQNLALNRGGKCLSTKYINARTKLKWQCADGHAWWTTYDNIRQGRWCPKCSYVRRGEKRRLSIEHAQNLALNRGGKCLSAKYITARAKLKWQCAEGHVWGATYNSVQGGSWCEICSSRFVKEHICRNIFEHIFKVKFSKKRPRWLINPQNHPMEFDGYNENLGLAFEYHGEQHFHSKSFYSRNNKELLNKRRKDDHLKKKLCKQNGVKLVEIPYTIPVNNFYSYIIKRCLELHVKIPVHTKIKVTNSVLGRPSSNLMKLQSIASKKGGELISNVYMGAHEELKWRCQNGHTWEATPNSVKRGSWCRLCGYISTGNKLRGNMGQAQALAAKFGGKCISTTYKNMHTKLKWQCNRGHIWEAEPNLIKYKAWCPYCPRESK